MGIDRRTWVHAAPGGRQVTRNVDALLAENNALRQEVLFLRQQMAELQARGGGNARREGGATITAEQVRRWGDALAAHPRWREVRVGAASRAEGRATGIGLNGLIEDLRRRAQGGENPGSDLEDNLQGPQSKARMAVRAAFALYGGAAPERLSAEPLRVVDDLLAGIDRMETAALQVRQQAEALEALGLHWGATSDAVKAAHRRLVKRHHPDMGGDAEAFRRINAAYQWLTA